MLHHADPDRFPFTFIPEEMRQDQVLEGAAMPASKTALIVNSRLQYCLTQRCFQRPTNSRTEAKR